VFPEVPWNNALKQRTLKHEMAIQKKLNQLASAKFLKLSDFGVEYLA